MLDEAQDQLIDALQPERPIPKEAVHALTVISNDPRPKRRGTDGMIDQVVQDIDACYWDDANQDAQKLCKTLA